MFLLLAIQFTRVSAAADRPARGAVAQRMRNKTYRIIMVIKPFVLLGLAAEYRSDRMGVINTQQSL